MSQPSAAPSPTASAVTETGAPARAGARPALEFKGLSHPALRLVINDPSDAELAAALDAFSADGEPGFEWQPVVIDAGRLRGDDCPNWSVLVRRLREARLHPVALAGAPDTQRGEAERLHLGWLAALPERRRPASPSPDGPAINDPAAPSSAGAAAESPARPAGAPDGGPAPSESAGAAPEGAVLDAQIIDRPVRSGQQVYARGRDLVVIGDVSPGAEVIADGNIHVYGVLAGRAIAGALGRRDANIFTLDLRAELVAVCGIYRTFEDGPPKGQAGKPVRITLEANADTLSMRTL
jgi:septum site-determining protein MinC